MAIVQEAWKLFLDTEETGFYRSLQNGVVQDAIAASANARLKALTNRKEILLGTNQYPNFTEKMNDKLQASKTQVCGCPPGEAQTPVKPLQTGNLSQQFNELRLATERGEKTPKAFMLTIGNLAMRLARSQFSSNFFACAGYQIIDNLGFETLADGVKAAREKQADLIVLCSSDDEYVTLAPELHAMLRDSQEILVIAGAPACMEELKAAGIEHFIHVRSNVLDTLKAFNAKLVK